MWRWAQGGKGMIQAGSRSPSSVQYCRNWVSFFSGELLGVLFRRPGQALKASLAAVLTTPEAAPRVPSYRQQDLVLGLATGSVSAGKSQIADSRLENPSFSLQYLADILSQTPDSHNPTTAMENHRNRQPCILCGCNILAVGTCSIHTRVKGQNLYYDACHSCGGPGELPALPRLLCFDVDGAVDEPAEMTNEDVFLDIAQMAGIEIICRHHYLFFDFRFSLLLQATYNNAISAAEPRVTDFLGSGILIPMNTESKIPSARNSQSIRLSSSCVASSGA
eukprot:284815279_5